MSQFKFTGTHFIGLVAGLAAFLIIAFGNTPLQQVNEGRAAYAAAVSLLMAIWWLTEALPIHITACVPLFLFPLLGVFDGNAGDNLVSTFLPYIDPYIWLFAGGMCIAAAMQQWDLHRRIALKTMSHLGAEPRTLLFGFLVATAFISMWISNTATATMMLPIGIAIIAQLEHHVGGRLRHFGLAVMLAIAYGSNIGGIGTKIGTAPNAQFSGFMEGMGIQISFLQFMAVGAPFVMMMLPLAWYALWRVGRRDTELHEVEQNVIHDQLRMLGKMKRQEEIVLTIFIMTASLWVMGKVLTDLIAPLITFTKITSAHIEASIAVLAALVLLSLRGAGHQILELRSLRAVPWSTLLLLGGSFAMAAGIQKSGLSGWLALQLGMVKTLDGLTQLMLTSVVTVAVSAVASNTATVAIMLNILKGAVSPTLLNSALFTSTISSSCDFALPAGTPPNAIVFGSGYVSIRQMAKTGIVLDLVAAIVSALWCYFIVDLVL